VAYGYWEQKGLTSTLTDQRPYEFAVSGAGDDYIDLANTYLLVEVMSVLASTKNWFHHLLAYTLIELTYKHYSAMAQLPKNLK
jgi:hypothetical protein